MAIKSRFLSILDLSIYLFIAATILAIPSILNKIPFFFHDSGFYIIFGLLDVHPEALLWRPMTYSLFLKGVFSTLGPLGFVWVQNFIIAAFLFFIVRLCIPENQKRNFLIVLAGLFLTALPIHSNFVMPDVFSGMMILSLAAILAAENTLEKMIWAFAFILSMAMHYSNLLVGTVLIFGVLFAWKKHSHKRALGLLLIPWILVSLFNYSISKRLVVSNTAQIFIFSQLSALGTVDKYLEKVCLGVEPMGLCQHRHVRFNIWDSNHTGRIFKSGGIYKLLPEMEEVNYQILSSQYIWDVLGQSFIRVFHQFFAISRPLKPIISDESLEREIARYSGDLLHQFQNQKIRQFDLKPFMNIFYMIFAFTVFCSLVGLTYLQCKKKLPEKLQKFFLISSWGYLANAFVCGFLTDPDPRYSCRIIWIFPFLMFVYLLRLKSQKDISLADNNLSIQTTNPVGLAIATKS